MTRITRPYLSELSVESNRTGRGNPRGGSWAQKNLAAMNPRIHNRQAFARVSQQMIASGVATIEVQPADFNYGYHPVGKYSNIPLDHLLYKKP